MGGSAADLFCKWRRWKAFASVMHPKCVHNWILKVFCSLSYIQPLCLFRLYSHSGLQHLPCSFLFSGPQETCHATLPPPRNSLSICVHILCYEVSSFRSTPISHICGCKIETIPYPAQLTPMGIVRAIHFSSCERRMRELGCFRRRWNGLEFGRRAKLAPPSPLWK